MICEASFALNASVQCGKKMRKCYLIIMGVSGTLSCINPVVRIPAWLLCQERAYTKINPPLSSPQRLIL
jgi:hypothetical protein